MNRSSGYSQDIGYVICGGDEPLVETPVIRLITCTTSLPDSCQPPASRSHTTKWLPLWASISLSEDHSGSPLMSMCSDNIIAFNVVADPRSSSAQVAEADSDPCRLVTHQLWPPLLTPLAASSSMAAASLRPICAVCRDDVDAHGTDCIPSYSWRLIACHQLCSGFGIYLFCIDVLYHTRFRPRWL